jgi:hypothetical protein
MGQTRRKAEADRLNCRQAIAHCEHLTTRIAPPAAMALYAHPIPGCGLEDAVLGRPF